MAEPETAALPDRAAVLAEIGRIMRQQLEAFAAPAAEAPLAGCAELDSIGLIVLIVALEDRFRVILRQSDAEAVVTFADLAELVVRRAAEGAPPPPAGAAP